MHKSLAISKSRIPRSTPTREIMRLAAIDIGSNSIHMIVAQVDSEGGFTTLWRMKEMVGLGRMSFPSHKLSRQAIGQALLTLRRFKMAAQNRQVEKIIAVATSAVREAENGGELIERIRRRLDLDVRVVSAKEEARLIYMAVRHAVELGNQPHLIVDIGGGSIELIVGDKSNPLLLESRKLGAARMTASFVKSDPISKEDRESLLKHYEKELSAVIPKITALKPVKVIGTSGTLENISALCGHEGTNGEHGTVVVERPKLEQFVEQLLDSTSEDRSHMRGLDEQRKDQIVAGALLARELFRGLNIKRMQMCGSALREGILLDYLARHAPDLRIRSEVPDARRRSVIHLARRCHWHQSHSEQVARLTTALFDETKSLHGMGAVERELIEYAALMHDIGWHIGRRGHHKHSMYLIRHGNLKNFSDQEIEIMAHVARYHRKSTPDKSHESYSKLPARSRRIVQVGSALLRMADGMDRSHCNVVQGLRCRVGAEKIKCLLTTRSDAELEIWGARRKRGYFEKVFDREILIESVGKR